MKRIVIAAIAGCLVSGVAWSRPSPIHAQQAAAAQAMKAQQKSAAQAVKAQQKAGAAMRAQQRAEAEMLRTRHHSGGGWHGAGPHAVSPAHHTFRRGVPPPDVRGWRRGSVPHPQYRSGWYGEVWYDAYGYPHYSPAVVVPAPVVVPPPPVVAPPPPLPPPRPAVVVPVRRVVY